MTSSNLLQHFREQGVLDALDVEFARTLGRLSGENDPRVLLGAAIACRAPAHGHVCADLERLEDHVRIERSSEEPQTVEWPSLTDWVAALQEARSLVRSADEVRDTPLVLEGTRLYLDRHYRLQVQLAEALLARVARPREGVDRERLQESLSRHFAPWTLPGVDRARLAACVATLRSLMVLTGGPGTGKTTAVVRILATLLEQANEGGDVLPQVLLLAPTGKAGARLKEAVREGVEALDLDPAIRAAIPEVALTIHKALGLGGPAHRRKRDPRMLTADIVVVDEASMVDLALMARLMECMREDARLILLGDRDQLASVEAGSVLGDLCNAGEAIPGFSEALSAECRAVAGDAGDWSTVQAPSDFAGMHDGIVQLTHVWRFDADSGIGALASAIHSGDPDAAISALSDVRHAGELTWMSSSAGSESATMLRETVLESAKARLALLKAGDRMGAVNHLESGRILAAHRRGPGGSEDINRQAVRWLSEVGLGSTRDPMPVGSPLLVTANDPDHGLFNGDAGVVAWDVSGSGRRVVLFPGGEDGGVKQVPIGHLPSHQLLHAMTVHKSQGSQFDSVVIVLPSRPSPVLTRELLYTAITRARRSVLLVGSEEIVRKAVHDRIDRASGLRDMLWSRDR
jgi:exodeoxyribonuclease V alpha subunit